ncbi:hypothetical protein [[Kitasatospora] papulosa]
MRCCPGRAARWLLGEGGGDKHTQQIAHWRENPWPLGEGKIKAWPWAV